VRIFRYLALLVLFLDLPVPLYWFILHPFTEFWRSRIRAAFWFAGLGSWTAGALFVIHFRERLLAPDSPSMIRILTGLVLIASNFFLLWCSGKSLGARKLVGHAELTGKTELTTIGIYKYMRHPRYTGMIAAVAGACLLAGSAWAWTVGAIWLVCALAVIFLEEREMRRRFGPAYAAYCREVPRFIPRFTRS
jgi:protein-S-isoprenylcysteine O-methyltransferase Ste14